MPFEDGENISEEVFELPELGVQLARHGFVGAAVERGDGFACDFEVECGRFENTLPQDFEQFPSVVAQYVIGGRFGLMFGQVVVDSLLENLRVASPYEKHLVVVVEAGVWRVAYRCGNHDERQLPAVALVDVDGILQPVELQVLDACQFEAVGFVERDGCLVVLEAGSEHDDTCLFELELGVVEVSFWRGCLHGGGGVAG